MTEGLRPMNLGEILDRTFQIYRSRFWAFVTVAAVPAAVMRLIYLIDSAWLHVHSLLQPFRQPGIFLWDFLIGLGFYHFSSFFGLIIEPAFVKLASSSAMGEECSIVSSFQFAKARWRDYFALAVTKLSIQLIVPEILLAIVMFVAGALVDSAGGFDESKQWPAVLIVFPPMMAGFGLFLWISTRLALAVPSSALEMQSNFKSLRRSWALSKGTRTRIGLTWLGIFITSWATAWGLRTFLWQLVTYLHNELGWAADARSLFLPPYFALMTAIAILVGPVYPIALTLFYYDQRIRKEGFDIERMMEVAGLNAAQPLLIEGNGVATQRAD